MEKEVRTNIRKSLDSRDVYRRQKSNTVLNPTENIKRKINLVLTPERVSIEVILWLR